MEAVDTYFKDIENLLSPFFEATLYAKSLGILSIKKPKFNINDILKIYESEIDIIIKNNKELKIIDIIAIIDTLLLKFLLKYNN